MHADVSVADPWFKEYVETETLGCSVVCVADGPFQSLIDDMVHEGFLDLHEERQVADLVRCQYWTVAKKTSYRRFGFLRGVIRVWRTSPYRWVFLMGGYRYLHYRLYMKLLKKYRKRLYAEARRD